MKFSRKNIYHVGNDEDLGISCCMGGKSRALFCPVSPRPKYPSTQVHIRALGPREIIQSRSHQASKSNIFATILPQVIAYDDLRVEYRWDRHASDHRYCIYRSLPETEVSWPEAEMSCMVGDGDVLYGRRRRCLVWPEMTVDSGTG